MYFSYGSSIRRKGVSLKELTNKVLGIDMDKSIASSNNWSEVN